MNQKSEVIKNYITGILLILLGLFKTGFGIYSQTSFKNGLISIIIGVYSLFIAVARIIYAKKIDTDEKDQIITYRNIALLLIPIAILFFISNILSLNDPIVDYGLWLDILITVVIILLLIFSFKKVFHSKSYNIIARSVKIISLTSALLNLVFIERLFEFQLNNYFGIELFKEFKLYFSMGIASIILFISLIMVIISFIKIHIYKKERGII